MMNRSHSVLVFLPLALVLGPVLGWAAPTTSGDRDLSAAPVVLAQAAPDPGAGSQPAPAVQSSGLQKPSGFWTSGRPAVGGAYRYRLLAIGAGVLVLTAGLMLWVIRRYPQRRS
ncbi:hypothetical protein [Haliangium sp.]|uniref:hypothetical protein n=2 Tax=Haliangium sp. TaxID=2663208 RepID=UPI003D135930